MSALISSSYLSVLGAGLQRLGVGLESQQVEEWHYEDEPATEMVYTIVADE
ncbi:hypothetical protein [Arthrobacter sp. H-02-3]|uniref:hypothetical protein n=1 Tax=Arthrobacter sp. H-02-3 TaxID=2703675 RepID=UPI00137AD1A4|nr:hypothetical protein [Arthrobacter sp. H-02-3]